jgi:hypothetical protein
MKASSRYPIAIVLVAAALLSALMGLTNTWPSAQAAPLPAPTPLSNPARSVNVQGPVFFFDSQTLTADTASTKFWLAPYQVIDLQYALDETTTNTTTVKLQYSVDGVTWTDGLSLISAGTTDTSGLNQFPLFGLFTRIYVDVSNTNAVGVTVVGAAK